VVVGPVQRVRVVELRQSSENPRRIRDERLGELEISMGSEPSLLEARPLIALSDGTVIAGNQRLTAAVELGWETVPVVMVEGLSEAQVKTWMLLDNQPFGEWDELALPAFLTGLLEQGIDPVLTGFEASRLDEILAGFPAEVDPEEIPPLPQQPRSREGELYQLGRHSLLVGDRTEPETFERLLGGERPAALVTDPPWGVSYRGRTAEALTIANDSPAGLAVFLRRSFAALERVLPPRTPFYVFAPSGSAGTEFRIVLREVGWDHRQTLIWAKDQFVLGHGDFHQQHEEILYGYTGGAGRVGRGAGRGCRWYGGNSQSTLLRFERPRASREHPTAKPVGLLAALIRNSSRRGELILDPFAGSGSTLIAADQLGRSCAAVELDPRYADVVRDRYEVRRDHG
jgi:site-specific DNA-methyltransferase (adenine-specific)